MPDDHILQWGNPALHETASPVEAFDDLLRAQANRLCRQLVAAPGVGLAATQVGSLRRMFAFRFELEHEPRVLVNPELIWQSDELAEFEESCLSFNSIWVAVTRPYAVRVVGYDVEGNELEFEVEGFEASLMQHELDHLDGVLTLDRAQPSERYRAMTELLVQRDRELRVAV